MDRIYPPELQLNNAGASDIEAIFFIYIYLYQPDLIYPKFKKSAITSILT